jgi:hypothetical protein
MGYFMNMESMIIGRMGLALRDRNLNIISILVVDARQISSLTPPPRKDWVW